MLKRSSTVGSPASDAPGYSARPAAGRQAPADRSRGWRRSCTMHQVRPGNGGYGSGTGPGLSSCPRWRRRRQDAPARPAGSCSAGSPPAHRNRDARCVSRSHSVRCRCRRTVLRRHREYPGRRARMGGRWTCAHGNRFRRRNPSAGGDLWRGEPGTSRTGKSGVPSACRGLARCAIGNRVTVRVAAIGGRRRPGARREVLRVDAAASLNAASVKGSKYLVRKRIHDNHFEVGTRADGLGQGRREHF